MVPGTVVAGKYLLGQVIGQGGMGAVWAARNVLTEREVALKVITDENNDFRVRLLREARACGRISHRNVIEIYDVGETEGGAPFLVMPLLTGETLSAKLRREKPLIPSVAAQIGLEMARALAAAHGAGIIHRDLKPGNVFLHQEAGAEGLVVKVLDFGVSKSISGDSTTTTTGTLLGSPAYMSPEQASGDKYVDHRTDLWALGVTLFEMLTGSRPFQGETMFTVVAAVLGGPIPTVLSRAPHVPPELSDLVARCMERDIGRRFQHAEEVEAQLARFASGALGLRSAQMPFAVGPIVDTGSVPAARRVPPLAPPRMAFDSVSVVEVEEGGSTTAAGALSQAGPSAMPPPRVPRTAIPWIAAAGAAFVFGAIALGVVLGMRARDSDAPAGSQAPTGPSIGASEPSLGPTATAPAVSAAAPTVAPSATAAPSASEAPEPAPGTTARAPASGTATNKGKPAGSAKAGPSAAPSVKKPPNVIPDDPG